MDDEEQPPSPMSDIILPEALADYDPCKVFKAEAGCVQGVPFETLMLCRQQFHMVSQPTTKDVHENIDQLSGLTLWEGAKDLLMFLNSDRDFVDQSVVGRRVIEIGCGLGLPGVVAMRKGAQLVDFQDISEAVLRQAAVPHVVSNSPRAVSVQPRFIAGTWKDCRNRFFAEGTQYDTVICSEGCYKEELYSELVDLLLTVLPSPRLPDVAAGVALFSGKRYYFGCGGGTTSFALYAQGRGFETRVVKAIEDGKSNVREIIELKRLPE
mmetsp:Transcript_9558/g.20285  ORF Transcript_9558/g.20285 Transcript_9558/m.20285 type:complete len:267 (-) Transcript_9558:476-1276(-)